MPNGPFVFDLQGEQAPVQLIEWTALIHPTPKVFKLVKDARNTYGLRQQDHQKYR
jgi:hypothetical protein